MTMLRMLRHVTIGAALACMLTACAGASLSDDIAAQRSAARAATLPDPNNVPTLPGSRGADPNNTDPQPGAERNTVPSTETSSTTSPVADDPVNSRGNIVKTLGEEGGLYAPDGTVLYTFAIDAITPDVECTEDYPYPAENGHLTAVQMRLSTGPVTAEELGYLSVSPYDFVFIGSDGLTFTNVATYATYACINPSAAFPSDTLRPGSQYAGAVLLDLPEAAGTLVYQPSSSPLNGWEITF